ncbi:MAG: FAD-dependent monooxygenase [Deltaproteobacteria bacterium]|nr:FAD-dependent monooxygenase [Deltaproteobacteria bacterium]
MGYRELSFNLPPDYQGGALRGAIAKELGTDEFSYQIANKSLDARKRSDIHWQIQVSVLSEELAGGEPVTPPALAVPSRKRDEQAVVVGSGPAGFFAAFVLQKAGFRTTLIERGTEVKKRARGIRSFETTGLFDPVSNYAFGEGGAGTFSDGKLTSRSKRISKEKRFIIESYIRAGAPEEIRYMAHPHLGSDNLKTIVANLRSEFLDLGGRVLFETLLEDIRIEGGRVVEAVTPSGGIEADWCIIAPGHSAYETYRMLMRRGVGFRTKPFALGSRVEHPQELINLAQWGREELPGVKAAEYRLTSRGDGTLPVYTFCMCPGGVVVPASAYGHINIVNGMSRYRRDGVFANAACVAGVSLEGLTGREMSAPEALDWLEALEEKFFRYAEGFAAPFCPIADFIAMKEAGVIPASSYPLGLKPAPLWELLPPSVSDALREGLRDFARKIKGFETGTIMGLESKTSSPVQVLRDKTGLCSGFENLYVVGEGSGWAGGIISSGADGIRTALHIAGAAS